MRKLLIRLQSDALHIEVIKNLKASFFIKISSMILGLLVQLLLVRMLGIEQFGIYTFIWAAFLTLAILGKLGFELAAIRLVATYRTNKQWSLLYGFIRRSRVLIFLASCLVSFTTYFVLTSLVKLGRVEAEIADVFFISLLILPIYTLSELNVGILRGLDHLTQALFTQNIFFPLTIIFFMLLHRVFVEQMSAYTIMLISGVALLLTVFVQHRLILKTLPTSIKREMPIYHTKEWTRISIAMMSSSGIEQLMRQLDIIVIGAFIGPAASGVYSVAIRFSRMVNLGLQISNQATAHMMSPLYVQNCKDELQKVVSLTTIASIATTLPIVFILLFWPSEILGLFGRSFADEGKIILQILLIGQLVNALSGPNGLLMNMTNYQNELVLIVIVALLTQIGSMWLLIPTIGVTGVAIARTIATIFRNIAITLRIRRHLDINPTIFSRYILGRVV